MPGNTLASRESVASPGFTRIRFRNGVILNFKRTHYAQSKAVFLVRFGASKVMTMVRSSVASTELTPVKLAVCVQPVSTVVQ